MPIDEFDDIRFQRAVAKLHRRGPRVLCEMLVELGRERLLHLVIEEKVHRFGAIDPGLLHAVGAGRLLPPPIHLVDSGR